MDVITLNVGQGAMAIVRSAGEAFVVDARIPPANDDALAYVKGALSHFLKNHNLRGLMLTGFDKDHADARGVAIVLRKYQPDWIVYPDYDKDTQEYEQVQEVIAEQVAHRASSSKPLVEVPVTVEKLSSRPLSGLADAFIFEIFSPHPQDMTTSNNCSLVVKVTGKSASGFTYLVTGDTENERWKRVNEFFGGRLRSDVMAAPHHGSRNAYNAQTLLHVSPNTVLISAGVDNPYGHPHSEVVQGYTAVASYVFGTYVDGGMSLHTRRLGDDFKTTPFVV